MFIIQTCCIRKRETVSCLQYIYELDFVYQKMEDCIIPTAFLSSGFCVSERGKLYYAYSMFIIQKEESCIIPTVWFCFSLYISDRGKLHHNCNMFMVQIYLIVRGNLHHIYIMIVVQNLYITKRQIVSYLKHFYHFDFVYQKEGNYIMPTICLSSRKRETVSYLQYVYHLDFYYQKEGNCHNYSMSMPQILYIRKRETVSYLQYVFVLDYMYQKEGNYIITAICL